MGRGRNGRGNSRGKGKGDAGDKSSQHISRVDLYKFLCKWELRSYPDNQGRPLFLLRRPLMGLNLASASIDSAALFLPKLASSLPQAQALLEKESLNEAVRYFNPNRDVERDSAASKEMCKTYFKQIQKAAREHGLLLAEAAEAAAAVYTGLVGGTAPDDALVTLRPPPTLQRLVALVQHDAGEKQNTKPVLVLLRVVVGGFHATKTARPTTTPWVGRAVAL
ncbi:hypothetical protein AK812_SmicGene10358 [Symbiodinium microadriaticum]|uniref:Uncharacterized protein n=1 Tax=Symbiodinium microadriaticum TaxID=2951 RepID=A0A1Q9EFY0_SYMMI|nr:hypothetical protein AK812_SmicGene10358 [Symbiodinium microadriaticum]